MLHQISNFLTIKETYLNRFFTHEIFTRIEIAIKINHY